MAKENYNSRYFSEKAGFGIDAETLEDHQTVSVEWQDKAISWLATHGLPSKDVWIYESEKIHRAMIHMRFVRTGTIFLYHKKYLNIFACCISQP